MGLNKKFIALVMLLFILLGILPNISERRDNYNEQKKAVDTINIPKKDYITSISTGDVNSQEIELNWEKVEEVSGYTLYRSDSEDGIYTEIYTIVDNNVTTYTDKNLTPWTNYYYKIKTFTISDGNREYGPDSKIATVATMDQAPVLRLDKDSDGCIVVSWNGNVEVDGYILYKSISEDGHYDDIDDVDHPSYRRYVDKNIDSDTTYYYKMRGYKYESNERIYGEYSQIKSMSIE